MIQLLTNNKYNNMKINIVETKFTKEVRNKEYNKKLPEKRN